jgi:hypothetical protein
MGRSTVLNGMGCGVLGIAEMTHLTSKLSDDKASHIASEYKARPPHPYFRKTVVSLGSLLLEDIV